VACGIIISQGGKTSQIKTRQVGKMFYWFTFEDGYRECVRGYDRIEKQHMIHRHGKIVKKEKA